MTDTKSNCLNPAHRTLLNALLFALMLVITPVRAEPTQTADWRQSTVGAVGVSLARSANGDYVVAGIESPSSYDPSFGAKLTLQRYRSDGQPVWSTPVRWTSAVAGVKPYAVLTDGLDNTFVLASVGDYNYLLCNSPPCSTTPIGLFSGWWLVQKYSSTGQLLWQRQQLQVNVVPIQGVVDSAGDLYVAFDPNSAARTAITSKLSGADGTTLWTKLTPDAAKPGAIALTAAGTVIMAGASPLGLSINEYRQADGLSLNRTLYGDAAGYYAPAMAIGPQGEIAFTGTSSSGLFLGLESAARHPIFSLATIPGAKGRQVAVDSMGRIVAAGTVPGGSGSGTDWLVVRYDGSGQALHAPLVLDRHPTENEVPLDLATAGDAAYITGAAGPAAANGGTRAVTVRLAANGTLDWLADEAAGIRNVSAEVAADDSVAALSAAGMSLVHYPVPLANQAPTSSIRVASVAGLTANLDASASADPDGTVAGYRWTFGDGVIQNTVSPTVAHTYPNTGTYTPSVVAVDNLGAAGAAASTSVSVVAPPTPTALTLSSARVKGGTTVTAKVTLSSTAGAVITVASSNSTVASVVNSVTVPAGSNSANFSIRTSKVRTNTTVTITTTANAAAINAALTVTR